MLTPQDYTSRENRSLVSLTASGVLPSYTPLMIHQMSFEMMVLPPLSLPFLHNIRSRQQEVTGSVTTMTLVRKASKS